MITTDVESRLAALEQEVAALHKLIEQTRIAARIRRGLDQAGRGQTLPAREALESLRQKYNIQAQ
jgi:hypothetical protein